MSNKDLSLNPQKIDAHNWYYEEATGIEIIHEHEYLDGSKETISIQIPWRKIRASVKRKDK